MTSARVLKVVPTLAADALGETLRVFGQTMLRIFTFPIPTVAAVSGHAVAGGAMLTLACDLRWMAEGPFRLHLNEVAIGLPLPTWALVLAQAAIPPRFQTEALLHARAYSPDDALDCRIGRGGLRRRKVQRHCKDRHSGQREPGNETRQV